MRLQVSLPITLVLAALCMGADDCNKETPLEHPPRWNYTGAAPFPGPSAWYPTFSGCKNDGKQSPIDLSTRDSLKKADPGAMLTLTGYRAGVRVEGAVENEGGSTLKAVYDAGALGRPSFKVDPGGETYQLVNVHVHFPSEHTVDGVRAKAEMHLVHASRRDPKKAAVLAFLMDRGPADPIVAKLLERAPKANYEIKGTETFDLSRIGGADGRAYYQYTGSLTVPPCTTGVTWYVMGTRLTVDDAEENLWTSKLGVSSRPPQCRGDRCLSSPLAPADNCTSGTCTGG